MTIIDVAQSGTATLVIRITDGLVMNFRMAFKTPGLVTNYTGRKKPGEVDLDWVKAYAKSQQQNFVS